MELLKAGLGVCRNRGKKMSKKLILIGVTGPKSGGVLVEHISRHLDKINTLFPDGISVICRETSKIDKLKKLLPNAAINRGSLTDKVFLEKAIDGADTIIHIAGIHWSREIADVSVVCNVRRLVLVHTTGIYSKYKAAGEEYKHIDDYVYKTCKENNILLTILRPTMIYGNIADMNVVKFISMVDKLPIMPVVNGAKYELQPVHYRDLAGAYYAVLINEDATADRNFNLSGGEPILLRDMLIEIGNNLGKKVKFISCPFPIAYAGASLLYVLTIGKKDYREKVQRLCEPRVYSHAEATKAFGYLPRTFQAGIVNEVKQYREKYHR